MTISPRRLPIVCAVLVLGISLCLAGCEPPVPRERDLLLTTATPGGTFYPVGVALATLATRELADSDSILVSAVTSSGSAENLRMLETGEGELAIVQALFASMAWQGSDRYQGRQVENLRSLAMLWDNVEQIVVLRRHAPTGTVADLAGWDGQGFSLGPRWSGAEVSGRTILETLDIDPDHRFRLAHLGYGPSADALQNRRIAGMFLAAGIPTAAVTQAFAALGPGQVVLLEVPDVELELLRASHPVWRRFVIPADTYPGQTEPVATIAQPNVLVAAAEVGDDVIHRLLETIWANLDFLQRQHAATRAMKLDRALEGLPAPLHPGAVRFYREAGLTIPDKLLPPGFEGFARPRPAPPPPDPSSQGAARPGRTGP